MPSNARVEASLKRLESDKTDDRIASLFALAELLSDDQNASDRKFAIPAIVNSVADRSDLVRTAQKIVLQQIGAPAAEYLKEYVSSPDFRTYAFGCEAIRTIGPGAKMWLPDLQQRLKKLTRSEEDEPYLIATIEALAGLGKESLPALDDVLKFLDHKNFRVLVAVCKMAANLGPQAKPFGPQFVELSNDGIPSARSWALVTLGSIGLSEDYDVVQLLTKKLDTFLLIDKQRALEGLSKLGPEAKAALPQVDALMNDPTKNAIQYAAFARWKITGDVQPSLGILTQLIDSRSVGDEAIQIIGQMGPSAKDAVPNLIKQLSSEEPQRRENAIWALGDIGSDAKSAIPQLEKLTSDDEDILIREIAKIVVKKINAPVTEQ
jgi:HEAT repeat protein